MTSRELIAWATLHERRAGRTFLGSSLALALAGGVLLAAWVRWRSGADPSVGSIAGTRAWLAGALLAFAVAFLRVPFLVYWRADAPLLAQLPIPGAALFDAAAWRCARAGAATALAVAIGALPLGVLSVELLVRHLAVTAVLGATAMLLLPAVAIWAAALVAVSRSDAIHAIRAAAGVGPSPRSDSTASSDPPSTAMLGALPGFAATAVVTLVVLTSPWLAGREAALSPPIMLVTLATASVLAFAAARVTGVRMMGTILRDISALDRQHLATLQIEPPTAIESLVARLLGDGSLPYRKDARLMRRRYPMAFALGAIAFVVLVVVGAVRPADPVPWLAATLGGAALYAWSLGSRLERPPIELSRLSAALPIDDRARRRAKLAWLLAWWTIFVAVPGMFASLRQAEPGVGLALLAGATLLVIVSRLVR